MYSGVAVEERRVTGAAREVEPKALGVPTRLFFYFFYVTFRLSLIHKQFHGLLLWVSTESCFFF